MKPRMRVLALTGRIAPSHADAHEPLLMRRIRIHAAVAEEVAAAAAW
jgi:hypothetical protein